MPVSGGRRPRARAASTRPGLSSTKKAARGPQRVQRREDAPVGLTRAPTREELITTSSSARRPRASRSRSRRVVALETKHTGTLRRTARLQHAGLHPPQGGGPRPPRPRRPPARSGGQTLHDLPAPLLVRDPPRRRLQRRRVERGAETVPGGEPRHLRGRVTLSVPPAQHAVQVDQEGPGAPALRSSAQIIPLRSSRAGAARTAPRPRRAGASIAASMRCRRGWVRTAGVHRGASVASRGGKSPVRGACPRPIRPDGSSEPNGAGWPAFNTTQIGT